MFHDNWRYFVNKSFESNSISLDIYVASDLICLIDSISGENKFLTNNHCELSKIRAMITALCVNLLPSPVQRTLSILMSAASQEVK